MKHEQAIAAIAADPTKCPACGGGNLWADDAASTFQRTQLYLRCMDCGAKWGAIHTFAYVDYTPEPLEEDTP